MTSKPSNDSTESPSKRQKTGSDESKVGRRERRQAQAEELTRLGVDIRQYNKQQLRRMCKRIARGLNPHESPQERHDRIVKDAALRREEEAELSGMLYTKEETTIVEQDDDDDSAVAAGKDEQERFPTQEVDGVAKNISTNPSIVESKPASTSRPKKQRSKAVPSDYTCFACKNTIQPAHWIYDCPNKQTVRGTNQVSKQKRGLHDPSKSKLFVSGLPFETTIADVKKLVADRMDNVPVESCRLLKFPDSARCRGQAYVSFRTAEEAAKVMTALNGMKIPGDAKKHRSKELQLRVTHVLNRSVTMKRKVV